MTTSLAAQDVIQDRYVVERALGQGAFATTYLCRDLEEDREVAVKVMRLRSMDGWKSFELFEREARVLKSLDHNGIPTFYDVFRTEGEQPSFCLVQEYVEGRSLQDALDEGARMSPPEVTQLVLGLLDILDHLHRQSPPVYHRDIKPSNILVRPMGAPVLIDFGSVCDAWRAHDDQGSTVAGTHGYMPPEQYMGKVGPTSDLYAIGATLLHVITGRHPSDFPFEDGRVEVPEALPCAPEIRTLLDRCLETASSARPESAVAARSLVLDMASATTPTTALVPVTANALVQKSGGNHPQFVDMGSPPRDPRGEFQDIYEMLIPSALSMHGLGGALQRPGPKNRAQALPILFHLFLIPSTFGFWLLILLVTFIARKRKYDPLFRFGYFTTGVVMGAAGSGTQQGYDSVIYSYEVDGSTYRNSNPVVGRGGVLFASGDVVGVLYDADDPQKAVIVFR